MNDLLYSPRDPKACRGLTLLELLAVVGLLSLVTSTVGLSMLQTSEQVAFSSLGTWFRDLDERARMFAQQGEEVRLFLDQDERLVVLQRVSGGAWLSHGPIPAGLEILWTAEGVETESLTFTRLGTTFDYRVTVKRNQSQKAWMFSGLTGWMQEVKS